MLILESFFAGLIAIVWFAIVLALSWDTKMSPVKNVILGIMIVIFLGVVYWVPFWLLFLK